MDERYAAPLAEGDTDKAAAGSVFEYFVEPGNTRSSVIGVYAVLTPMFVGVLVAVIGLPNFAVPAVLLTAFGMWWYRRRQRKLPRARLVIHDSRLRVVDRSSRVLFHVPLSELLEVELDTKTIQRVQENTRADVLPAMRLAHATVGPATDIARIVLVTSTREFPLTEDQHSHSYAMEAFGEVRRFLRKHGWVPADERAAE